MPRKLTVNITDSAAIAIRAAAESTGLSEVDTISRALTTYAVLMVAPIGQRMEFTDAGGGPPFTVVVVDRQGFPDPPGGK